MTLAKCTCRERRTFSTNWESSEHGESSRRGLEMSLIGVTRDLLAISLVRVESSSLEFVVPVAIYPKTDLRNTSPLFDVRISPSLIMSKNASAPTSKSIFPGRAKFGSASS
ncbi:hypothetical protein TNCT_622071 [Trichonephila clavata]|uniref:Uncharacterized protein n=1 Tax=Trichonephila clavata TaxID=2740835 RepID=A0A8X6HG21_TRICU|nr:hypothetical protein TNCT_622071 [Trichonephila clavata]